MTGEFRGPGGVAECGVAVWVAGVVVVARVVAGWRGWWWVVWQLWRMWQLRRL